MTITIGDSRPGQAGESAAQGVKGAEQQETDDQANKEHGGDEDCSHAQLVKLEMRPERYVVTAHRTATPPMR